MDEKTKVLIVEDDLFLSDLYKMEFEKYGFLVTQAFDGADALAKVSLEKPAIIILDLILPEFSGLEVLEKIKGDQTLGKTPIVVLSNLRDEEVIKKALALGADGYIIKATLTPKQVVEEAKKYLNNSASN